MPSSAREAAWVRLRPARPDDVPAITAIYAVEVKNGLASWEYDPPGEAEMLRRMLVLLEEKYPYLVAEIGTQVAGYAYAGPYRPRPGYRFTVEDSVYVGEAWRARGIGIGLLQALIEACTSRGFRQMVAVIGDSHNRASIALHRTAGFVQVGLLPTIGFKSGQWLDAIVMQRSLGEGATTLPEVG